MLLLRWIGRVLVKVLLVFRVFFYGISRLRRVFVPEGGLCGVTTVHRGSVRLRVVD